MPVEEMNIRPPRGRQIKKSIPNMKRSLFIIAVIASGLCACNKVELKNEAPERAAAVVYHMSLQASFDARTKGVEFGADGQSISSQFATTDNIYVYNCTKGAFARYYDNTEEKYLLQAIHPSNLSDSDRTCDLEGDLTFYKLNDLDEWVSVEVAAEDTYSLYYQMNDPDYLEKTEESIRSYIDDLLK